MCRTFAFRVGCGESTPPAPHGSNRLCTGIGSVESLCGGIAARMGRSSCRVVEARREAQPWEEQVIAQSISRSLHGRVSDEQGTFVECRGDVDRQCGVVSQVKPPVQPHVNLWCRKLSARYGLRAQRVVEASHPGPRTQIQNDAGHFGPAHRVRRVPDSPRFEHDEMLRGSQVESGTRKQRRRLRALPWSWDSDSESDGPEQSSFRNVVPRTEGVLPETGPRHSKQWGEGCVQQKSHCVLWVRWRRIWTVVKRHFPGGWCCTKSHPEETHDRFRTGHPTCRCVATGSQHWQTQRQVHGLSCSSRFVRLSQVCEPALAEREVKTPRLPSRFVLQVAIIRGVSPKPAAHHCVKDAFIPRVCFFASPGCAYTTTISVTFLPPLPIGPPGISWSSLQRFMIIGALKRNRKGWLFGDHASSSEFRLSVFPSVHRWSPSDVYLVFLRESLRDPQLVLFQHSNLRASPVRDVLLTCQVGPVSSQ